MKRFERFNGDSSTLTDGIGTPSAIVDWRMPKPEQYGPMASKFIVSVRKTSLFVVLENPHATFSMRRRGLKDGSPGKRSLVQLVTTLQEALSSTFSRYNCSQVRLATDCRSYFGRDGRRPLPTAKKTARNKSSVSPAEM